MITYQLCSLKAIDNYILSLTDRAGNSSSISITIIDKKDLAYRNWSYSLNKLDNTITLNQYIGDETEVTVYDSYKIDGVTYQTKLKSRIGGSDYMFSGKSNIKSITFSNNIDTSDVTNMWGMFSGCSSLIDLDLSYLNTSNVTDMHNMFFGCVSLTNLDLSNFDMSNVTDIQSMFSSNSEMSLIEIIGIENWDTSNFSNLYRVFYSCSSLKSLNLNKWNTSLITNMQYAFYNCRSLENINLNNWDTSNVTNMMGVFGRCESLENINLNNWDTSKTTDMRDMFYYCSNLTIVLVAENKWITNQASITGMFDRCKISSVTYI